LPVRRIVQGQHVSEGKYLRAKEFRRAMTPAERTLWSALRGNQLNGLHFRRQQIIDGFVADFYCHTAGLIVEVDGPVHDDNRGYDAERNLILTARGLHIVRVTNEEVLRTLPAVLAHIAQTIANPPHADARSD
jgi:very-short-patch-repair endonuclease